MGFALVMDLFQKKPFLISSIILLLYGILQILWGDVTQSCNGYGQDGCFYGGIVENFHQKVFVEKLNPYYIQRIFPLGLIHYTLLLLQIPLEPFYIIKGFQVYHLLIFLMINYIWYGIFNLYNFKVQIFWLGWVFIFVNHIVGKNAFFNPVLTDYTAYFLGFALLYYYLKNNLTGILIISFLGAFTWASFMYFSFFFILFPVQSRNYLAEFKQSGGINYWFVFIVPLAYFLFVASNITGDTIHWSSGVYETIVEGNFYLFYVATIINFFILILFFWYYVPTFIQIWKIIVKSLSNLSFIRVISFLLLYVSISIIIKSVSTIEEQFLNPYKIHGYILFNSIQSPLFYIIEAVTSLGIVFIILVLYFKRIFQEVILKFGLGFYISFLIFFAFKLIPESRLIINYFPVIIFLICYFLNNFFISVKFFWVITLFSFIFSRIYLSFLGIDGMVDNETGAGFFEALFINQFGLSRNIYLLFKLSVFVLFFLFFAFLNTKLNKHFYYSLKTEKV